MTKDFIRYILDALEDDEIPYEIKYIYFCLHRSDFYYYISIGGSELKLNQIINFEYYPLEFQFYNVIKYKSDFTLLKLKQLIEQCLNNKSFYNSFKDKTLFVAVFGENESFEIEKE